MPRIHASATRARTTHMRHTFLPRKKTKVQSKVQLRGEMVSVHEDVKQIYVQIIKINWASSSQVTSFKLGE